MQGQSTGDEPAGLHDEIARLREREAATRSVLQIINQSPSDAQPVFDVILETAAELCHAPFACFFRVNQERTHLTIPSFYGTRTQFVDLINDDPLPLDPSKALTAQAIIEKRPIQIADFSDDPIYCAGQRHRVHAVEVEGVRTVIAVPLLIGDEAIGVIFLYRREVSLFTDDDIRLVETFAAHAAIAIENVRQFRELQTANAELQSRLEREAATREILSVISRSRDDERPVFNTILENAARLCNSPMARLHLVHDDRLHHQLVAVWGEIPRGLEVGQKWPLTTDLPVANAINNNKFINIDDFAKTQFYLDGNEVIRHLVDVEGFHSYAAVPLLRDGLAIGCITLSRRSATPFAVGDIALVETFAEQAVIAIENVRQFKALESLNAELGDRVEEQVGEIERMGKLKRFLPAAVADSVVSQGSDKLLKSHRVLLGVLFCDIRGFTAFCESAEPEETIEVLQTYHEEMGKLINEHGAGVDHRMGDGIMVLFNDPLPCDDPAGDAVRLAIAMQSRMAELSKKWKRIGHRLGFGVGVSLGYATVGMVGYEGRSDYTASGTAVNLAARLCDLAADGEILLSPRAYTAIEDDHLGEPTGEVTLKGIREPVEVYRLQHT